MSCRKAPRSASACAPSASATCTSRDRWRRPSNPLDVAINGRGWFQISGPSGETLYTRAGSFNKNAHRPAGHRRWLRCRSRASPFPHDTLEVVDQRVGRGLCADRQPVGAAAARASSRSSTSPTIPASQPLGNNLYRETAASGTPISGVAGDPGFGSIHQGYLENSNVDPVKEITELISAQRAYEMNSKVIQAADEMLATVSKGIR